MTSDPNDSTDPNGQTEEQTIPDESPAERVNRELEQFLGEMRVALPGVQVVFAFLLTVPFSDRFSRLGSTTKDVYVASLCFIALTSVLLIAPTVHHRLQFRQGTKEELLRNANRFAIAGMVSLAFGLGAACYVAGEGAIPGSWARWVGVAFVAAAAVVWFALPFSFGRSRTPPSGQHHRGS